MRSVGVLHCVSECRVIVYCAFTDVSLNLLKLGFVLIDMLNTLRTGAFKLFKRPLPGFNPLTSTFIRCFFKNL